METVLIHRSIAGGTGAGTSRAPLLVGWLGSREIPDVEIGSVPRAAPQRPARFRCGRGRTEGIRPRREADDGARAMPSPMRMITDMIRRICAEFTALSSHWNREMMAV